ncbi:CLUMA_CG015442, isoform A [Clunio marinus]|uniref:CLUMA_CG015442, isoform A n=1 Tax=Clunio marinus TaxID=568069 RepID=A0A1J1IQH8_9DIPT|nr:CLUMA_CG015442, isoform A [Clunio marinus]
MQMQPKLSHVNGKSIEKKMQVKRKTRFANEYLICLIFEIPQGKSFLFSRNPDTELFVPLEHMHHPIQMKPADSENRNALLNANNFYYGLIEKTEKKNSCGNDYNTDMKGEMTSQ